MILQGVDYVEGNTTNLPYELRLAYYVKNWGIPDNWMEWQAGIIERMNTIYTFAKAFELYGLHATRKGWVDANQHIFEKVTTIWGWRKEMGLHYLTGLPLDKPSE